MTQAFDRIVLILYGQFMLYVLHLIESVMLWPQAKLACQFQRVGGGPEHCGESIHLASGQDREDHRDC